MTKETIAIIAQGYNNAYHAATTVQEQANILAALTKTFTDVLEPYTTGIRYSAWVGACIEKRVAS